MHRECACGSTRCQHIPPSGPPHYGGDLFTTNCEEGRHAWRVDWEAEGHPVTCKWCDKPRYTYDDNMTDFEED